MTLNVNYNGKHIGFVARSYPENKQLFMVALTNLRIEEVELDMEQIKSFLGKIYGDRNFWGKVIADSLQPIMETKRQGKYKNTGIQEYDDFLRFKFLKTANDNGYEIEKLFKWEQLNEHIDGYILIDVATVEIEENTIFLTEPIDYISEEILQGEGKPIFAVVKDYPIFRTDIMGAAEGLLFGANFSDFGRNHAHETELRLKSGNFEKTLTFPIHLVVKKGMPFQLYLVENKIKRIFCNESIYEF